MKFDPLKKNVSINSINSSHLIFTPTDNLKYFYEPSPNVKLEESIDNVTGVYKINSDSLNIEKDFKIEKPDNTFRVVTLGDSWTFGMFVNTNVNYPSMLEKKLNTMTCDGIDNFEVINLGMIGYDVTYSAERYAIRGKKYNPDLIIWFIKDHNFYFYEDYLHELINNEGSSNYPQYGQEVDWSMVERGMSEYRKKYKDSFILNKHIICYVIVG